MSQSSSEYAVLMDYLRERGYSETQIAKILEKVRQYDRQTEIDSVMDSIDSGQLNLNAIIKEALGETS